MLKLPPDQWVPGQILARPVENETGQILAMRGISLTEHMIEFFRHRGIHELCIKGGSDGDTVTPAELLETLERRFAEHEGRPFMLELKQMFIESYREQSTAEEVSADEHGR